MKHFMLLIFLCLLTSCEWFVSKDVKTRELVEQEMLEIDCNEVDSYPLFESCDESATKTEQRKCFEKEVLANCAKKLKEFEYVFKEGTDPMVQVDFLVDQKGKITVVHIEKDSAINKQMPGFDQIIKESLGTLPHLSPALKRGIPVKTKFRIPIVFNTD
jgi:hypothetical protein